MEQQIAGSQLVPKAGDIRPPRQLNIDIPAAQYDDLTRIAEKRGTSKRQIVQQLIDAYVATADLGSTYHLTGEQCPLSKMIDGIAEEIRRR